MIKVYKENVIESLKYLSDYEFQKQAWLDPSGPYMSSFVEEICQLYDDTGLGDAFKAGKPVFHEKADKALHELNDLIDKVNHRDSAEKLLDDPAVQKVREKAAEALKLIQSGE